MKLKKILASVLTVAMLLSVLPFSAFAANYALAISTDKAAAGDLVTVSLAMDPTNDKGISALEVYLGYDTDALEFISADSTFGITSKLINDDISNKQVRVSCTDNYSTQKVGTIFEATFKVKSGATGGPKSFTVDSINAWDGDATNPTDLFDGVTVTGTQVNIQAPRSLTVTDVAFDGTTKTATWTADAEAKDHKIVLYKDGAEIYTTTVEAGTSTYTFNGSLFSTSAKYTVGVTALKVSSLFTQSAEVKPADATVITVDGAVTPTSKAYVTNSGDVQFTLDLKGNTFAGIEGLTETTDYTFAGNVVTIKEATLNAISSSETYNFKFKYDTQDVNTVPVTITVTNAADSATFVLAEKAQSDYRNDDTDANDGSNDGLIVVTGAGNDPLLGFLAAQFKLTNTATTGFDKVEYEVVPADGFALLYDADADIYEINAKPVNGIAPTHDENVAGEGIVIGKLVRKGKGYGAGTITANNVRLTVEKSDNTYKELTASSFDFKYEIPEPTRDITVNVDFVLPVKAVEADYQKMAVTLYSARLGSINLTLGNGVADYTSEDGKITATVEKAVNGGYTVTIKGLPAFEGYTVAISGDGYRDAKAQFVLNENTTVNFWNNANEAGNYRDFIVKETSGQEKRLTKNFLAGDVIMNGTIDLYDLSAVSSYFGKKGLTKDDAQYIQYDLDRDTKVDITDITMLLAGWAE